MLDRTKTITTWTHNGGYGRHEPSAEYREYLRILKEETNWCDPAREKAGYEKIDDQKRDDATGLDLSFNLYEHRETRDIFVEMTNGDQSLATVHVDAANSDAFLVTEYLRMVQQAMTLRQAEVAKDLQKAVVSFIRHGHGKHVINEFGTTFDERQDQIEGERLRKARAASQPG